MLDVHAVTTTPGAGTTLGSPGTAPSTNDGCPVAGVPLVSAQGKAKMRMFGFSAPTADTIAALKFVSQDMPDAINGYNIVPGTTSVLTQFYDYYQLPFVKGARQISAGTNTGVVAGHAWYIDEYQEGLCVAGSESMGQVVIAGQTTFGGALTTNVWGSQAYAPATPIHQGKYAILGAFARAVTNNALIRFSHADFKGFKPGFPISNYEVALATAKQLCMKDELIQTADGSQFIYLSKALGVPCCPVFNVGPSATGLTIEMISVQADTPDIALVLAKVGENNSQ